MSDVNTELTEEEFEAQLPEPAGYRILVAMPTVEDTFDGSVLVKASVTKSHETVLSMTGLVVALGPQAYADKDRFPTGAWCKPGDYVLFSSRTGTRLRVNGAEYRLMNDDSVEAIVKDPRGISRAH